MAERDEAITFYFRILRGAHAQTTAHAAWRHCRRSLPMRGKYARRVVIRTPLAEPHDSDVNQM